MLLVTVDAPKRRNDYSYGTCTVWETVATVQYETYDCQPFWIPRTVAESAFRTKTYCSRYQVHPSVVFGKMRRLQTSIPLQIVILLFSTMANWQHPFNSCWSQPNRSIALNSMKFWWIDRCQGLFPLHARLVWLFDRIVVEFGAPFFFSH